MKVEAENTTFVKKKSIEISCEKTLTDQKYCKEEF